MTTLQRQKTLGKILSFVAFCILVYYAAKLCRVDYRIFKSGIFEGFQFIQELFPPDFGALKPY